MGVGLRHPKPWDPSERHAAAPLNSPRMLRAIDELRAVKYRWGRLSDYARHQFRSGNVYDPSESGWASNR